MDARAPAVVALVVARDPGPWFEETLAALRHQDYPELSVLVLLATPDGSDGPAGPEPVDGDGETDDLVRQISEVLPDAFVRRCTATGGFGAAVNEGMDLVEGAAFFLLCHDDVAPDPDAVHLMVEESFRSNAAIVTPKIARWDDASRLLHVGMGADRAGAPVDRVQSDEVDHGQHDAVRDVFFAPGGCTLVRADLLRELGGFDAGIVAMGEDLDLGWRAQLSGARVVVAPRARVRHLEALAAGLRPPPATDEDPAPALGALARRHQLRTLLKCSRRLTLLYMLPWLALLDLGELVVAAVSRDDQRRHAITGAWGWNFRQWREVRRLRAAVRAHRQVSDRVVRRAQVRGSARLATFLSRLTHQGFDVARGREAERGETPELTGSVGGAFSEDGDFDDWDDLGQRERRGRRRGAPLSTRRTRLVVWLAAVVILVIGTRSLIGSGLPLVGQLVPFPSWTGTWHHFVAGWQPAGVGTTAPATPAYAVLGMLGTVLLGGMGLTQKLLIFACIPVGVWGLLRLLRPICSRRARLVAGVSYLGIALPYDALAQGRLDGLLAYAALPWILLRLARATGVEPYDEVSGSAGSSGTGRAGWRRSLAGQMVVLGVIDALVSSLVPAMAVVVLVLAVGLALGGVVMGRWRGSGRVLAVAVGATVVAAVLCLPWVIGTLVAGRASIGIFGATSGPWSAPSFGALIRFDLGPIGGSPLSWLLPVAALLPLVLARRSRLAWAGRLWMVACLSWILAWVVGRGWTGNFSPPVVVLVAPAAVAVAAAIGLGVAAFEMDLSGFQFGWRQVVSALTVAVVVVGLLPVVIEAGDGRWGLPADGYAQPLSWLPAQAAHGPFRVLWLGDPRVVPGGSWRARPGLAYTTSENSVPDGGDLWEPAGPGPAAQMAREVQLAMAGATVHLGQLLALDAVRYVVVVTNLAPAASGSASQSTAVPPPGQLLPALDAQDDLRQVPGGAGYAVFQNNDWIPARAERSGSTGAAIPTTGWSAVLPGPAGQTSYTGIVRAGTVLSSAAPAGGWSLSVDGRTVARRAAGWAARFDRTPAGTATLSFSGRPLVPIGVTLEILLWIVVAAALAGVRWRPRSGPRRRSRPSGPGRQGGRARSAHRSRGAHVHSGAQEVPEAQAVSEAPDPPAVQDAQATP